MEEILVHISAPATRQNDDLYRSLADAYMTFEPYPQNNVEAPDSSNAIKDNNATKLNATTAPTLGLSGSALPDMPTSNLSRDTYGSFPSNMSSENHSTSLNRSHEQHSFEQAVEPDSLLSTSRLGQLERIQANWRKRKDPRSTALSKQRSSVKSPAPSADFEITFLEDSQLAAQAIESQLYDSVSATSEDTSEDESLGEAHAEPVRTECFADIPPVSQASTHSQEATTDHPRTTDLGSTSLSICATESPATNSKSSSIENSNISRKVLDFGKLAFETFAPSPKVSVECPGTLPTQITKHLRALQLQNPKRFKPTKLFRTLNPDERGYWLIETANWPRNIQYDFWSSLCEHVRDGKLGWGVTTYRDPPNNQLNALRTSMELGSVRLYCWGEVVEHIWLSIWLCSKGKVTGSGTKWIDAEDRVVIRMP